MEELNAGMITYIEVGIRGRDPMLLGSVEQLRTWRPDACVEVTLVEIVVTPRNTGLERLDQQRVTQRSTPDVASVYCEFSPEGEHPPITIVVVAPTVLGALSAYSDLCRLNQH